MDGKKNWYVVDGWIPQKELQKDSPLEGHEALIILNCNAQDAVCYLDFYFEDKDPIDFLEEVVLKQVVEKNQTLWIPSLR